MGIQLYFENYTPVGDIIVAATCFVIFILLWTSYVNKTKSFGVFLNIVIYLMLAAFSDIIYHFHFMHITDGNYTSIYIIRIVYHAFLFSNLLLYVVYLVTIQRLEKDKKIPIMVVSVIVYLTVITVDIVTAVNGTGFRLDKTGNTVSGVNVFLYGYLAFLVIIVYILIVYRKRLFRRLILGFYGTLGVSFLVLLNQGRHGQSSFTVATFLFPTLAMLYLIHSNPYDIEIGAINSRALEDMVRYNYKRKRELIYMSLLLPEFEGEGKTFPKEIQERIRAFSTEFFKGAVLFQITNGHVVLMAKKSQNPDYENRVNKILNAFDVEYEKYQYDYKIVVGSSIDEISRKNEYISFINSIHRNMNMNDVHVIQYEDVALFNEYELIISELSDIYKKNDLEDERVLVYCQPVYNIKTKKYDTAEALMRLNLTDKGIIYPDKFIPVAEDFGFIHVLTRIILHKTCVEIKSLIDEGYEVNRISVNVSVQELRDENFTEEIRGLIRDTSVPDDKIAIEITESMNESDFVVTKNKIEELKDKGIKFYLDDFGTGYSNMERIMELPFDIIKFDRSLVTASDIDERSQKMVGSLANLFSDLNYSVLYEGVENEVDEKRCINMNAAYLQGYKYSRPVPIHELRRFFEKKS